MLLSLSLMADPERGGGIGGAQPLHLKFFLKILYGALSPLMSPFSPCERPFWGPFSL